MLKYVLFEYKDNFLKYFIYVMYFETFEIKI